MAKYKQGNIFNLLDSDEKYLNICITTNNQIKKNGCAVMGRGNAKEATQHFPGIEHDLGIAITNYGKEDYYLVPFYNKNWNAIYNKEIYILALQTKRHWGDPSEIELIKNSLNTLYKFSMHPDIVEKNIINCPMPGIGNGQLKFEEVKNITDKLPNNFIFWSL